MKTSTFGKFSKSLNEFWSKRNNLLFIGALSAMLPVSGVELSHRWSFNGDFSDSIGGTTAQKVGNLVSFYGGRVHLGGNISTDEGYVNLGTNLIDTTAATIELWARHDGVRNWSRIFDYGPDENNYFFMSWTYGEYDYIEQVGSKVGAAESVNVNYTMAPYVLGEEYYIAVTFERQEDGKTLAKWQRRDVTTGELQKSGSITMSGGLQDMTDPVFYLGHSQYEADKDALAAYNEVRIWNGVLTEDQKQASAVAGPDATIAINAETPSFTPLAPAEPVVPEVRPNGLKKIMTFNIRYCYDPEDVVIPERTAARIIAENPDFCCINEVRDSNGHPEARLLAKFTGMHKTYGENLLLSKEIPISTETIKFDSSSEGWGDRSCTICEFSDYYVAVTHLDTVQSGKDNSLVQASNKVAFVTMQAKFAEYSKPVFLCGDWNTRPNWDNMAVANEFLEILSPTNGVRTFHGSGNSSLILDYISVTKKDAKDFIIKDAYVVEDRETSDHAPVCVEFYRKAKSSEVSEWINESMTTTGLTGSWSTPIYYDVNTLKAEVFDATFNVNKPSDGPTATLTITTEMSSAVEEQPSVDSTVQAALRLGMNGKFEVWAKNDTGTSWIETTTAGENGGEYTFTFLFNYTNKTYSVSLSGVKLSSADGTTDFKIANDTATSISSINFVGETLFTSLHGSYEILGFAEKESLVLKDNIEKILTAAQAAWLNKMGDKETLSQKAGKLSAKDFDAAFLVNLDITKDDASYEFKVSEMEMTSSGVTLQVTLDRNGALDSSINGVLKIYGSNNLGAGFTELQTVPLTEGKADATVQPPDNQGNYFYRAVIE